MYTVTCTSVLYINVISTNELTESFVVYCTYLQYQINNVLLVTEQKYKYILSKINVSVSFPQFRSFYFFSMLDNDF